MMTVSLHGPGSGRALAERSAAATTNATAAIISTKASRTIIIGAIVALRNVPATACPWRVIVMDEGRVVECGHHHELMARNGPYARMFHAQAAWYRDEATLKS